MPQSGCFIIQLPRRVLRVYWLGYLPGTVFRERVSGASSLVCTGLYKWTVWSHYLFGVKVQIKQFLDDECLYIIYEVDCLRVALCSMLLVHFDPRYYSD